MVNHTEEKRYQQNRPQQQQQQQRPVSLFATTVGEVIAMAALAGSRGDDSIETQLALSEGKLRFITMVGWWFCNRDYSLSIAINTG